VVELGNERGRTRLHARVTPEAAEGVLISEGVWPPSAFLDGWGINVLVGDDSVAPFGGVAFHDVRVWLRPDERPAEQAPGKHSDRHTADRGSGAKAFA